ncbi:MAG: hypothetical protein HDT46_08205 [Ruminococcaceae bacterium]|nr:hypothetical protein [Oscillospiraceae bacterium]
MPKKTVIPKINTVTVSYTGDEIEFEKFILSMTADYLNSDTLPEYIEWDFGDMVEVFPKSA